MLELNLKRFLKHSSMLGRDFSQVISDTELDQRTAQHSIHMMSVVLQDTWAQFVRGLIVSSASGKAISITGQLITGHNTHQTLANVEQWLIDNRPSNRDVDWHVSDISLRWARNLAIPNLTDVVGAIGSITSPENELRSYRNFIVHRCKDTAEKARLNSDLRRYNYSSLQEIPVLYVTGGSRVFEDWIRRFQMVATVASKT